MKQHIEKCATKKVNDPKMVLHDCDCDGYHTMDELYEHRIELFITLCKERNRDSALSWNREVWRSKFHSDGTSYNGWFLLGIGKDKGKQITYHLPLSRWDDTNFAETLDTAPAYDGHTTEDVLKRLKEL